jgi:hypothetical protein
VLLGEVKSRIYRREVEQFLRHLAKVEPLVEGDVIRLMFGYFIDLSAEEAAAGEDVLLVASYEPVTMGHGPAIMSSSVLRAPLQSLYVPSSQDAKYFACSSVRMSICTPIALSLSRAIS